MKKIIVSLFVSTVLFACDPNEDSKVGTAPRLVLTPSSGSDGGIGANAGNSTDAPIDGGISILLIAGAAYGVKRFRNKGEKGKS